MRAAVLTNTLAIVVAAFVPVLGGARHPQPPAVENPAALQVEAAETIRTSAKRNGDLASLNTQLSADFIEINRFGRLMNRQETISLARNPSYSTEGAQIRVYDGAAVVLGRESDEAEPPGTTRFLRVWVRDAGRWLLFFDEGTKITSEPELFRLQHSAGQTAPNAEIDSSGSPEMAESKSAAIHDLRGLERTYREAERIDDMTVLTSLRRPDFVLIDRLADVHASEWAELPTIKAVIADDIGVRVHRGIAVVIGRVTRGNLVNGATDRFRYSTVWVIGPDGWKAAVEQRTPLS